KQGAYENVWPKHRAKRRTPPGHREKREADPKEQSGRDAQFVCGEGADEVRPKRRLNRSGTGDAVPSETQVCLNVGIAGSQPGRTAVVVDRAADLAVLEIGVAEIEQELRR